MASEMNRTSVFVRFTETYLLLYAVIGLCVPRERKRERDVLSLLDNIA